MNKNVLSDVIVLASELASKKKGSLFIISGNFTKRHYDNLYPELFKGKNVKIFHDETKILLKNLCELDGGILINTKGVVQAYGVKVKKTKILRGHGTRHSAARGASLVKNTMVVLSSEEDGMLRIFKGGEILAEIDPETGKNKNLLQRVSETFSKPDIQVATSGGVASLLLGLNPLMAGAIFTGSWIITKYGLASVKDFSKTGKIIIKEELANDLLMKNLRKGL